MHILCIHEKYTYHDDYWFVYDLEKRFLKTKDANFYNQLGKNINVCYCRLTLINCLIY